MNSPRLHALPSAASKPGDSVDRRVQTSIWREFMRVQNPKRWALDLGVEPSTITRWASGERAFGADDQANAERIAMAYDRADIVQRIRQLQNDELGDTPEPVVPCPIDTAREAGHLFADAVDSLLKAGDGIDPDERKDLRALHTKLISLARKVETLVENGK